MRLQALIAQAGIASRRSAERMIRAGAVTVNGHVVTELGTKADPLRDRVVVEGRPLKLTARREYLALNKPVGVVTTLSDPEGRPSVGDLVRSLEKSLHPVGRLDFHTSGLLLLTNDGELTARLTHPRYHVPKTYVAKVDRAPSDGDLVELRRGVRIDAGRAAHARIHVAKSAGGKAWITITVYEGRNRQVRRMLEELGFRVEKLRRTSIGPLSLGSLPTGRVRTLTSLEVTAIRRAAGLE